MAFRKRLFALIFVPALLLICNGYSGAVLWTFTAGPRVTALVTDCSPEFLVDDCKGTWTLPDGTPGGGELNELGSEREGDTAVVRVGPLGAYVDAPMVMWARMIPLLIDVIIPTVLVAVALLAWRARRAVRRFEAGLGPGDLLMRADRLGVLDRHGSRMWLAHRVKGVLAEMRSPGDTPVHRTRNEELPKEGLVRLWLERLDGTRLGHVENVLNDERLEFTLRDAGGAELARLLNTSVLDSVWTLTSPAGEVYGRMVLSAGVRVAGLTAGTPAELRPLVAMYLMDAHRLNTAAVPAGIVR